MVYTNVTGTLPEEVMQYLMERNPKKAQVTLLHDYLGPVQFPTNERPEDERVISYRPQQEEDAFTRTVLRSLIYRVRPEVRLNNAQYENFQAAEEISGIIGDEPIICWDPSHRMLTEMIFRARVRLEEGTGDRIYRPSFLPEKIKHGSIESFVEETYFLFPEAAGMRSFMR